MPLSKKRDKERKQRERAKIRLEKAISPSQEKKAVQPSCPPGLCPINVVKRCPCEVDADGNRIYEE